MSQLISNEKKHMKTAIEVMKKSYNENRPDNKILPKVRAVLITHDEAGHEIISTAYRGELRNSDHAEYTLLERKNRSSDLTGGILYVTLEPCAPGARTSPKLSCAERIVNARIATVYVGIQDPDPTVADRGISFLKDNGVVVQLFDKEFQDEIIFENHQFLEQAIERAKEVVESTQPTFAAEMNIAEISELSQEALNFYAKKQSIPISTDINLLYDHFVRIGLMTKSGTKYIPTKECIILFGKAPHERYHCAKIVIKANSGIGEGEILKTLYGPMILMPKQAEEWYEINAPEVTNTDNMERKSLKLLPSSAFREALVNAIVHRDYSIEGSPISITISSQLIEIKSPGLPIEPITVNALNSFNAPSIARNPKFAFIFSIAGYVEQRGHGLDVFRDLSHKVGLPLPHYSFDGVYLNLSFALNSKAISSILPEVKDLTDDELLGFEFIRNQKTVTKSKYAEHFGIQYKTAQRQLSKMKELGLILDNGLPPKSKNYAYVINTQFLES